MKYDPDHFNWSVKVNVMRDKMTRRPLISNQTNK